MQFRRIFGTKSDGKERAIGSTDDGRLKVDADISGGLDSAGLATSARQDAGNTKLTSIDGKLPALSGGKIPVVVEVTPKVQLYAPIDFSSDSAQTIIVAPGAGYRIRLTRLSLMSGSDPQVYVEAALKSGATLIETVRGVAMVFDYPEHRNLGTNEAFVVQCTSADRVIGGADYYVEAV